MPWYRRINAALMPAQHLVTVLLVGVIVITTAVLFAPPAVRTAWLVFLLSP
jgi:hypothetical protein